jgi:DNA-binding beta-propeller fold protein YncE
VAVDPRTNRIYLSDLNERIFAFSGQANKLVDTLPGSAGGDEIAVDPRTNRIYEQTESGPVTVDNGSTMRLVATIPVGNDPMDVAVDPLTNTAYVTNLRDNAVSVITG